MEINTIKVDSYPSSEKIYLNGALYPIKVAMRKIKLTPTVTYENGERIERPNDDLVVYDTSGAYTDPNVERNHLVVGFVHLLIFHLFLQIILRQL